jgi:hypothetical protein
MQTNPPWSHLPEAPLFLQDAFEYFLHESSHIYTSAWCIGSIWFYWLNDTLTDHLTAQLHADYLLVVNALCT